MKKLFSKARYLLALVSLVLLGTNVALAATETVFSAKVTATDKMSLTQGKTMEITNATATLSGGKMYAINTDTKDYDMIAKNSGFNDYMFNLPGSKAFYKVELNQALAEGDIISVKGCSRTGEGEEAGIWISTAESRPNSCPAVLSTPVAEKAAYVAFSSYTITENDVLKDQKVFYIYRSIGKGVYFNEFEITREVGDDPRNYSATTKWDFTQWSEATVTNLKADAAASETEGWSDVEALENNKTAEASKDNCFWAITTPNSFGELSADGVVIEELKGLVFGTNVNNRGLAIAVNYPEALSTYHGGAYLWLGGAEKKFFTIPAVKGGSTIKMGVESHKDSEARGVKLLINGTSALKDADGNEEFKPTTYAEQTWSVTGDEPVDIVVDNVVNGSHIYYIEVEQDLVVKLKFYVAKAKALTGAYTDESVENLNTAVEAAEKVVADQEATEENVKEALETLLAAKDALVEDPLADLKAEVTAAISDAESSIKLVAATYTEATMAALKEAITKANEALNADEKTEESLTAAKGALTTAKSGLTKKEFVKTVTYAMQDEEAHTSGDAVDVESVAELTYGVSGGEDFKAAKANTDVSGFAAFTEGNGVNGKSNEGTVYIIKPEYDGLVEVGIVLSENKNFYVEEDGKALDDFNGITVAAKLYGIAAFNVKGGSEYRVYGTGTKLGFYGFNYKYNTVEVSSHGWATFIPTKDVQFEADDAYIVTEVDAEAGTVMIENVTAVPAGTPVLLKGEGEKTVTVIESATAPEGNLLEVCEGTEVEGKTAYVLAKDGDSAGFKKWGGEISALAGRAVLWLGETQAARTFFALGGETTGIKSVATSIEDGTVYDLQGRRVAQPKAGLYIVNGKKVVIK